MEYPAWADRTWAGYFLRQYPKISMMSTIDEVSSSQLYASFLTFCTLPPFASLSPLSSLHLAILLFSAFLVSAWRNLVPLGTYMMDPKDAADGRITWLRISLLALSGVIVPLFMPRQYKPVNPEASSL